jgi:hypothetical protein
MRGPPLRGCNWDERSHHLTAALYFGVAGLERFLNHKLRVHLQSTKSHEEIFDVLRKGRIVSKLKNWPEEMLGKPLNLDDGTLDFVAVLNDVRGDLRHPKTHGHDIYGQLEAFDPMSVISTIAEYIVRFNEAEGTTFPLAVWMELP